MTMTTETPQAQSVTQPTSEEPATMARWSVRFKERCKLPRTGIPYDVTHSEPYHYAQADWTREDVVAAVALREGVLRESIVAVPVPAPALNARTGGAYDLPNPNKDEDHNCWAVRFVTCSGLRDDGLGDADHYWPYFYVEKSSEADEVEKIILSSVYHVGFLMKPKSLVVALVSVAGQGEVKVWSGTGSKKGEVSP